MNIVIVFASNILRIKVFFIIICGHHSLQTKNKLCILRPIEIIITLPWLNFRVVREKENK